jgi:beta-lactamase superfamily II metal-dependent hydrolase
MGDLENTFMEKILAEIKLPKVNILFAPHHGRKSGKVPSEWMAQMNPDLVVMGEAPSKNLDYAAYDGYNKITQNSAGDIRFECNENKVHIYVSSDTYQVDFLEYERMSDTDMNYLGTLNF